MTPETFEDMGRFFLHLATERTEFLTNFSVSRTTQYKLQADRLRESMEIRDYRPWKNLLPQA